MRDLDDASYVPGSWVAITAASGCLLVDLVAEDPVVRRCWKLLSEDAGADAVLDALAAGGIAGMPGFALVMRVDDGQRAIVRHPGVIEIHGDGDDGDRLEAAAGISWRDVRTAARPDAISLLGPPAAATVELPMGTGVTTASVVHLRRGVAPAAPPPIAPPAPVFAQPPAPEPMPAPEPVAAPEPVTVPEAVAEPEPEPVVEPVPEPAAESVTQPVTGAVTEAVPDDSYDHLFGASIQRPLPQPAATPPTEHTAGWMTVPPVPAPAPAAHADGLIEGVPWAASDEPEPASPPAATVTEPVTEPESSGSDTTATVSRAQVQAAAQQAAGPTVLAGRCPSGHLSPPYADRCRVCRAAMPAQDAIEITRPTLGVLRLQSGDVVTLDRGVLLGRSPDVPTGSERPHVLRLKSPDNDISRNHAEIVLDGWNVYVRDLGSTNGTVVELAGRAPVRLRDNDLTLLEDGAKVVLAEEITVVYEVQA